MSAPVTKPTVCVECGGPLEQPPTGRPRLRCRNACRQTAWRRKQQGGAVTKLDPPPVQQGRPVSWAELCEKADLNDGQLRRALVKLQLQLEAGAAARARLGRLRATEKDRQLFADDPGRRVAA
jgi:hypothetical protein